MSEFEQVNIKTEHDLQHDIKVEHIDYDEVEDPFHDNICSIDIKEEKNEDACNVKEEKEVVKRKTRKKKNNRDVTPVEFCEKMNTASSTTSRKATGRQLEMQLKAALKELQASKAFCEQLLQERDDSEAELQKIVDKNTALKNELVENDIKLSDATATPSTPAEEAPGHFPCHICGAVFDYLFQVTRHLNEHVRRTFPCPHCTCTFNYECDLDTHLLIHNNDPNSPIQLYNCDVCGEKFPSSELLELHSDEHKDEDNSEGYPCDICKLKLKSKYSLKIHMSAKHLTVQPFSCEECGKQFPAQWRLKEHMKYHNGDSLPCPYCDKQFIQQSKLDMHLMSHTGEKPYECKVCYKRFSRESNLKVHMRLHTGQKNFRCELCEKAFFTNSDLNAHRKVHDKNKPKPFKCPECESAFALKTQMKNHYTNIHSKETPFACEACNVKFKSKKNWKYHTMMQHSDEKPHKCSVCNKGFLIKHLLDKHMRTHTGERPYNCQYCAKSFKSRSNLNTHVGYMHKDEKKSKNETQNNAEAVAAK